MGTDIHLQVEIFHDGAWKISPLEPFIEHCYEPGYDSRQDPTHRNYELFAFLADVRNGFGFAGISTHERIKPQFARRGLPPQEPLQLPDLESPHPGDSWMSIKEINKDYLGDHSFTYATLEELQACDWNVEIFQTGIVNPKEYLYSLKEGEPRSWCGAIWGKDYRIFDHPQEFADFMTARGVTADSSEEDLQNDPELQGVFGRVFWRSHPLADCAFRNWVFGDRMRQIAESCGGPQNVRVLMGFDS